MGSYQGSSYCKICDPEDVIGVPFKDVQKAKAYKRSYYEANRLKVDGQNKTFKQGLREWLKGLKEGTPCADCKREFPEYVMDYHHRPGEKKLFTISNGMHKSGKKRIEEEIAKCDLVCANCHRIRHNDARE